MRRVVVTGMGIVSSIGNDIPAVLQSLKSATPGIVSVHAPWSTTTTVSVWETAGCWTTSVHGSLGAHCSSAPDGADAADPAVMGTRPPEKTARSPAMASPSATLVLLLRVLGDAADMTTTPLLDPRDDRLVTPNVTHE